MANKSNSRVTNTVYNFTTGIGGQFLTILINFAVRTVFIQTLGKSYLGINGIFSNILSMLSLTELGMGTAILYKLYEPVAKQDILRIRILMKFYKSAYQVIGLVVALLGVAMIPFLPILIKDYDNLAVLHINAVLLFMMFVFRSVSSYLFFSYKKAIIQVHQREYIINLVSYLFTVGAGVARIVFLLIYPNFYVYLLISIFQSIGQNLICAVIANRMYPYIKDKIPEALPRGEVIDIIKDCTALFIYRANSFVLKATDNIVLSAFAGLEMVALYSNYYMFYTTLNNLLSSVYDSLTHSLGNLHTEHKLDHEYEVFKAINLITAIIGGTILVGITCVADEFVKTWIGADWVVPQPFALLLGIELYTLAINKYMNRFRTIMGLFQQAKYRPVASMIINVIASILLVQKLGISGVLIGTIIANWSTMMWYDPWIVHKKGFENRFPVSGFFLQLFWYWVLIGATCFVDYQICTHFLTGLSWLSVIVHAAICGVSVPLVLWLTQRHKPEGKYVVSLFSRLGRKLLRRGAAK